jgi:predicted RNA binding protein YcfA (HicA-like mRNA interferase family)
VTSLKGVSGRRLLRALERLGFVQVSAKGSHVKLRRVTPSGMRTVIVPMHRTVSPGVIESILELGGLSEDDLKRSL